MYRVIVHGVNMSVATVVSRSIDSGLSTGGRNRRALRCTILRTLLQEDYRGFSCQLAGNPLYQWFCLVDALDLALDVRERAFLLRVDRAGDDHVRDLGQRMVRIP